MTVKKRGSLTLGEATGRPARQNSREHRRAGQAIRRDGARPGLRATLAAVIS
jgi:hypothetical protein